MLGRVVRSLHREIGCRCSNKSLRFVKQVGTTAEGPGKAGDWGGWTLDAAKPRRPCRVVCRYRRKTQSVQMTLMLEAPENAMLMIASADHSTIICPSYCMVLSHGVRCWVGLGAWTRRMTPCPRSDDARYSVLSTHRTDSEARLLEVWQAVKLSSLEGADGGRRLRCGAQGGSSIGICVAKRELEKGSSRQARLKERGMAS